MPAAALSSSISSWGLDLAGVEHRLLAVDDFDAFFFERAQHGNSIRSTPRAVCRLRNWPSFCFICLANVLSHVRFPVGSLPAACEMVPRRDRRSKGRSDPLCRRRGIPQIRQPVAGQIGVAVELVSRPLADMRRGDVADIVEVEKEDRSDTVGLIAACARSNRSRCSRLRNRHRPLSPLPSPTSLCHRRRPRSPAAADREPDVALGNGTPADSAAASTMFVSFRPSRAVKPTCS